MNTFVKKRKGDGTLISSSNGVPSGTIIASERIRSELRIERMLARDLTSTQKARIAKVIYDNWHSKDGKDEKRCLEELELRAQYSKTPISIAVLDGQIEGVIFPIRVRIMLGEKVLTDKEIRNLSDKDLQSTILRTWDALTGNGSWSTDCDGNALYCPQIAVSLDMQRFGIAGKLIDGALLYASENDDIDYAAAYSRCGEYGKTRNTDLFEYLKTVYVRNESAAPVDFDTLDEVLVKGRDFVHLDPTIHMHLSLGAIMERVILNGCPKDSAAGGHIVIMGYSHLL